MSAGRSLAWLLTALCWGGTALAVPRVSVEVVRALPHDTEAFTQGLLLHAETFYESTGLYGASSLRQVELHSGRVLRLHELSEDEFGEGLALVGSRLWLLTWKNQRAYSFDVESFVEQSQVSYEGEGWGLCHDGQRLVMSNGSSALTFRDAASFEVLGSVEVRKDGALVTRLNELECVGDYVFANVWQTDEIVQIEQASGEVVAEIDAAGLLTSDERAAADVLNGIAYDPATGHFYVTGKLWPWVFEVRLPGLPGLNDAPDGGVKLDAATEAGPVTAPSPSASVDAGPSAMPLPGAPPQDRGATAGCDCHVTGERTGTGARGVLASAQDSWGVALGLLAAALSIARRRARRAHFSGSHCKTSSGTSLHV